MNKYTRVYPYYSTLRVKKTKLKAFENTRLNKSTSGSHCFYPNKTENDQHARVLFPLPTNANVKTRIYPRIFTRIHYSLLLLTFMQPRSSLPPPPPARTRKTFRILQLSRCAQRSRNFRLERVDKKTASSPLPSPERSGSAPRRLLLLLLY